MLYASKVIELLSAHPGRDFRMIEIIRYVGAKPNQRDRHRVRVGVARVVGVLAECGTVLVRPPRAMRGGYALYRWVQK